MKRISRILAAALVASPSFAQAPPKPGRPRPAPEVVLEGIVKGADGKPVDQAVVTTRPSTGGVDDKRTVRTDVQGRFRLVLETRTPQTVRVEAKGLAGKTLTRVAPGSPLTVVLDRGGVIEGVVRDGRTGQPVAKAAVRATDEQLLGLNRGSDADILSPESMTDTKGLFRIEGVGAGGHRVVATAHGFGLASKPGVTVGRSVELFLFPGGWIVGTVLGPDGRPVTGVVVRAEGEGGPLAAGGIKTTSEPSGRFELSGLGSGMYRLVATHADYAPAITPSVWVEKGAESRADIVFAPVATVSGRLVGSSGEPVAGAVNVQELDGQPVTASLASLLRAEAGSDGRFRIERVPAGSHALAVFGRGSVPKRVEIEVEARGRGADLGDVALDAGLTIRGQVRDKVGDPVAAARVSASSTRRTPGVMIGGGPETRSEADGAFVLVVPSPGDYRLTASAPGLAPATRQAEAGAENVELVLEAAGSITGVVVDERDAPLDLFRVNAQPTRREGGPGPIGPRIAGELEAGGRFTIPDVAEGSYVLEVSAPDRASASVSDVKVTGGGRADAGRIRLAPGGSVRGSVVDANGRPIIGATVSALVAGRERLRFGDDPRAVTDATGSFELKGLAAGTIDLQATHPQFADGRTTGVVVDPALGTAEARIVMSQGGRIEGSVKRRDGTGVSGARIQLVARALGFSPASLTTTRPDGTFVLEHVPAGRVNVVLLARLTGGALTNQETKEVDVREGEASTVEIVSREILVGGRVTRGGQPAAGLRIRLQGQMSLILMIGPPSPEVPSGAREPLAGVSREDGGYELIVNQPGKYTANVFSMDGRLSYSSRSVEIPDAEAFTLDFDFAGFPLAGVVLDDETGQPVPEAVVSAEKDEDSPAQRAATGPDGRFYLELDPGRYKLEARARGYEAKTVDLSVSSESSGEVKVSLSRGSAITGRVVGAAGRGVGGLQVSALVAGDRGLTVADTTLPDGSFQLSGLHPRPYTIVAGSELGGVAIRPGIKPGSPPLTLTLQPGGRVRLRARTADGQPVEGAVVRTETVDRIEVTGAAYGRTFTDGEGIAEFTVPLGVVELRVSTEKLSGAVTVTVPEGATVSAEVELSEQPGRQP